MGWLHDQIRTDIEKRILSGQLVPGDKIPTEAELVKRYDCARMTVSRALSALTASGLLERRKRAGTFVAYPRLHAMVLDVPDLQQEVVRRGQVHGFRLLSRRRRGAARSVAAEKALAGKGELLEVEGLHLADGRPLARESRLISIAAVPSIVDAGFEHDPPGTWLLQNVPWTEAATRISATGADSETASILEVELGTACLTIVRSTWRGKEQITTVRQIFPGNAYDLSANFAANNPRADQQNAV